MLVVDDNYIHPDFEIAFVSLNKEIVCSRDFTFEFAFIDELNFLFLFCPSGASLFLQIGDSIAEFLKIYVERIFYGCMRGDVDPVPKIIRQIGRLEDYIVITLGFLYFHPTCRILHRESIFFTAKSLIFLGARYPRESEKQYGY